jgi:RimJ/RimL family protein N-acetyltransferase
MPFTFNSQPADLNNIVIDCERVRLVTLTRECTREIFENFTPEVTRYMIPAPASDLSNTEAFIDDAIEKHLCLTDFHWVIQSRKTGEFLGVCGLHLRDEFPQPELGIWVKKAAHGNGFGREAIYGIAQWAAQHVVFDHLIYPVDRRNFMERKVTSMSGAELDEVVYAIPHPGGDGA